MIKEKLSLVSSEPGCYLMKNKSGAIIYVGKAKNLKRRLNSYFNRTQTGKTKILVNEIRDFSYIVTTTEAEAFILENNLIKKHNPKYNVLLKDDKSYPYIELTNERYPRLNVKREININKKHKYLFGPYPNVYAARRIVNLLNRVYPLRKCDKMPKKECLYFHINECLGYCINKDIDDSNMKSDILSFLNGNDKILIDKLKEKIKFYSDNLNYEQAKLLKEELDYINDILEKQKVELNDGINRDIFNYYVDKGYISIQIFFLRNGKLIESSSNIKPIISTEIEELEDFIVDFYSKKNIIPKEIIVPTSIDNEVLSEVLNTKVLHALKGKKKDLLDMAFNNAKISLENEIDLIFKNDNRSYLANKELGELLNIKDLSRIEAFDNSNLFGTFTVSGMVTFVDGLPSKNDYRKYKISVEANDDYHTMKEVIYRRYFKVLKDKLEKPDLIIVDGGVNQINACKEILSDFNLDIKVCGLKKNDKHRTNELIDGESYNIINIDKTSNVFYLLTRIQDEVHRYTINYHKQIRSKGSISSVLDNIIGIGEVRKKELIKKYGSVKKMKEVTLEEFKSFLPEKTAENIFNYLKDFK